MPGATFQSVSSSPPLTVLVAGAGIGGLTAALGLRKQGHNVHVFERSRLANEVGAAIHVAPNANVVLRRLGVRLEEGWGGQVSGGVIEFDEDLSIMLDRPMADMEKLMGTPYHLMHRAHLHAAIKAKAVEAGVNLHTSARIAEARSKTGEFLLEGGKLWKGDLIVGADGVHSRTRSTLPGADRIVPYASGRSAYRFLIPLASALAQPNASKLIKREGQTFKIHLGQGRVFVGYACVDNTILNCFVVFPSERLKQQSDGVDGSDSDTSSDDSNGIAANQDWSNVAKKETLLRIFDAETVPVAAREILELADENGIRLWDLMDMETLPTWVDGSFAGLGDAVHPFTPWRGQGGAMAIEDAASLAALMPPGTAPTEVPERLRLYQSIRHQRATEMQHLSRHTGGELHDTKSHRLKEGVDSMIKFENTFERNAMLHDEWANSEAALKDLLSIP